jgi:hypothetical protein
MRDTKNTLPSLIGGVFVVVIVLSWLWSAAQFVAQSRVQSHAQNALPTTGSSTSTMPPPSAAITFHAPATVNERLRILSLALEMYIEDYSDQLPPMHSHTQFERVITPYVLSGVICYDPETGLPFGLNPSLSHRKLSTIRNPSEMVVFYQPKPNPYTKKRWVVLLDGRMIQVDGRAWQRLSKRSGIGAKPTPPKATPKTATPKVM